MGLTFVCIALHGGVMYEESWKTLKGERMMLTIIFGKIAKGNELITRDDVWTWTRRAGA